MKALCSCRLYLSINRAGKCYRPQRAWVTLLLSFCLLYQRLPATFTLVEMKA